MGEKTADKIDGRLLEQAVVLVREVGRFQMQHFRNRPPGGGDEKEAREFVSEVDLQSERRLVAGLKALLPEVGIFGEEEGQQGSQRSRWIIDPLDGTTNYLSGLEQFSISVALEIDGRLELGVVYRPASGELFSARRGHGLRHNGQPVQPVDAELPLAQALIGTGFPYRSLDHAPAFFTACPAILYASRGIRRMGSAALDLSYVAAGFLQGFWESDLQPYDMAAALLFLEEQGCVISNERGAPYRMGEDRVLVAGWPQVQGELLELIQAAYQGAAG